MSFTKQLQEKLAVLSDIEFDYTTTSDFKKANDLDEGCTAIAMNATVIYVEIKNIDILLKTGKRLAARVYKLFYHTLKRVCEETGGHLNCYSSHGFLMIYSKDEYDISYVVDIAMKTADLISIGLKDAMEKHNHNSFAMGVDNGNILGTRATNDINQNQMIWVGRPIEKAIVLSQNSQRPFYVSISRTVFHSLDESLTKTNKRILGIKKEVDIWTRLTYVFENTKKHLYQTNFHRSFDEGE
jgi:hypothetical protein